ncbi:major royal jelly family protein [Labilibaculum sp. DW002]|uniref:Major royal jelly family protein n=1 Tax=Paralabilibaculum antarcticum TaxID=2912572 RepID=A0ABT5VSZ4_9BACT|nr:L-dopachrome tautomerase-related protein [Labilibaculum sp. DW002]MDE5417897.1 major royal jelly family protein [Labilibaculum sp. DW002]
MKNLYIKSLVATILILFTSANINAQTAKLAETVLSSETVRTGNMTISPSGRMFVSINPLLGADVRVYEIGENGETKVYPNAEYSKGEDSKIKAIIGIRTDRKNNLWLLDMGAKQFIVWDTENEKLVKTIEIPENVVTPASFLQDFVIDEKHNRVIIADMTQGDLKSTPIPAFIVIDTKTGAARRMIESHASMMPDFEGGFALNPIAIDPNFKWVYFGALHGKKIYRVPAKSFDSDEELTASIEEYSAKSYSDGIAADKKGNVYISNIEQNELAVSNAKDGFRTIATLPVGQTWPDGLHLAKDGYLYSTVDQLNRVPALNNGKDDSVGPFIIVKTKLTK